MLSRSVNILHFFIQNINMGAGGMNRGDTFLLRAGQATFFTMAKNRLQALGAKRGLDQECMTCGTIS